MQDFTFVGMWNIMSGFLKSMTNISADLCQSVLPVVVGAFIIQLVWQGFNIMRGQGGNNHVLDVFAKSLRVMIICTVALQSGIYNDYITGMISGPGSITDGILLAIDPSASGTPFDALDSAFKQGMSSYGDAETWALGHLIVPHLYWIGFDLEFPGPTVLLANGIFLILFIILLVLAFADLVVNSLALAIIFAVGPVFIACYAYEPTAQFTQTWLSGALKWSFTNIVIVVVINMFVFIVNSFVGTVTSSGDGGTIIAAIFGEIMAVVALIILCGKAHQIAADFVGGMAGTGFTQRIGQVATGAINGAKNGFMTGGPMGALRGAATGAAKGAISEGGGGGGAAGGKGLGANFLNNMGGK